MSSPAFRALSMKFPSPSKSLNSHFWGRVSRQQVQASPAAGAAMHSDGMTSRASPCSSESRSAAKASDA